MTDDGKTPDELEAEARREAEEASRAQADSEVYRRASRREREQAREDAERDQRENAMGDALHHLVGAVRTDRKDADEGDFMSSIHLMSAREREVEAEAHARRANELLRRARFLRRVGAAVAAVGVLMTIGGFAGVGNPLGQQPPQGQRPALEDIRTQPPASGAVGRAPVVGPIVAVLNPPDTSYTVQATDPDGDALSYTWTRTSTCGTFSAPNGPTAVWGHPHPPCDPEEFHPGIITVVVTDGKGNNVNRQYAQGSLSGTGTAPTVPPTVFPTTTTRPSTATPSQTATATPAPATSGGGPNVPLVAGGLILLGGGGALAAGGGRLAGGPVVADGPQNQKRTCDRERAEEARTRAEMERTKVTYDQLQQTKSGADFAEQQRRAAERALTAAEGRAGGWMTNPDGSKRYPDNDRGRAATAAQEALDAATADARSRRERFEGMGGEAALRRAKDAYDAAKAAHDAAYAALQACLESIAPPPAPEPTPPPPTGGATTGGGGTTTGPTGPVVSQGSSSETRERQCTPGEKRNERSTTADVRFNMINQAKIVNDSNYPGVNDIDVFGFLDWLEFIENAFSAGKAIDNFASGNIVEGTLDVAEFPDFFTYFGKMQEAVDRGLRRMVQIAEGLSKTGTYHLEYPRKTFTLTCATWEECVGGRWEAKRGLTMTLKSTDQGRTGDREVHEAREVGDALNRLFRPLEQENARAEATAKAFQERCGS